MGKYQVEVIENLGRVIEVEANSYEEAEEKVQGMYDNSDIVLDWNDCNDVDYKPYPSQKIKDDIHIIIDYDKKEQTLVIASENSSGAKYKCRDKDDLECSIKSYLNCYVEVEKVEPVKDNKDKER